MTSARDDILANIRRSLDVTGAEAPRRANVAMRLQNTPAGIIPERGQLSPAARVAMFKHQAERAQASVAEVAGPEDVPAEVARFLRSQKSAGDGAHGRRRKARGDAVVANRA